MRRSCSLARRRAFTKTSRAGPSWGAAGRFLEELLAEIGLTREQVFIANVVKCRPPGNREPLPEEIAACRPFLDRQIELIRPKLVVTLGRFSTARAFPDARISHIHGTPRKIDGILYYPMYHPAAALHQPRFRRAIEDDMRRIPELIEQIGQIDDSPPPMEAEQLRLF